MNQTVMKKQQIKAGKRLTEARQNSLKTALQRLADSSKVGNAEMEPYGRLKRRIRYSASTPTAPSRTLTPPFALA